MICVHCDAEFDRAEKAQRVKRELSQGGKANECFDCISEGPPVMTGVMIYGHKTAASIQINKDPNITKYMLAGSPSNGSRTCMVASMPKSSGGVHTLVTEVAKRRE
jgi:hypothetical protein